MTWTLNKENINTGDLFIIRHTLHRAFINWSEVSSLRFIELPIETKIPSDITISFVRGQHGDKLPFDGPGKRFIILFKFLSYSFISK